MNEAMLSFLAIVELCAPYSLAWAFGTKAFFFVIDAITGRNIHL